MTNRFVVDTNVLISALLFKNSVPFRTIELVEKQGIILYSEATLNELEQVLNRKKINKYLSLEDRQVFLLKWLRLRANWSVKASDRIQKSWAKTLRFRFFVENQDGVFFPL